MISYENSSGLLFSFINNTTGKTHVIQVIAQNVQTSNSRVF